MGTLRFVFLLGQNKQNKQWLYPKDGSPQFDCLVLDFLIKLGVARLHQSLRTELLQLQDPREVSQKYPKHSG